MDRDRIDAIILDNLCVAEQALGKVVVIAVYEYEDFALFWRTLGQLLIERADHCCGSAMG